MIARSYFQWTWPANGAVDRENLIYESVSVHSLQSPLAPAFQVRTKLRNFSEPN